MRGKGGSRTYPQQTAAPHLRPRERQRPGRRPLLPQQLLVLGPKLVPNLHERLPHDHGRQERELRATDGKVLGAKFAAGGVGQVGLHVPEGEVAEPRPQEGLLRWR
jgi:hypothetical protein